MPTESIRTNTNDFQSLVTGDFLNGYKSPAALSDRNFRALSPKLAQATEISEALQQQIDRLLARLPILQEQSEDPDEEGDLPVSDETVRQMRSVIQVLASVSEANRNVWLQPSLSVTPSGGLQISWRTEEQSLSFTVTNGRIVRVQKRAGEQPERTVLSDDGKAE